MVERFGAATMANAFALFLPLSNGPFDSWLRTPWGVVLVCIGAFLVLGIATFMLVTLPIDAYVFILSIWRLLTLPFRKNRQSKRQSIPEVLRDSGEVIREDIRQNPADWEAEVTNIFGTGEHVPAGIMARMLGAILAVVAPPSKRELAMIDRCEDIALHAGLIVGAIGVASTCVYAVYLNFIR